jgi:hypothetical protein
VDPKTQEEIDIKEERKAAREQRRTRWKKKTNQKTI